MERTSILAIVALVLSILCVTSPLGLVLGIGSVILISTSRGRLGGMGMAITSIVIGALGSLVIIGGLIAVSQVSKMFEGFALKPAAQAMRAIQDDDPDAMRQLLDLPVQPGLSDEQVTALKAAYEPVLGDFVEVPESTWQWIKMVAGLGDQLKGYSDSRQRQYENVMPVPAEFAKGVALLLVEINPSTIPGEAGVKLMNLAVVLPDGTEVWLMPRPQPAAVPPGAAPDDLKDPNAPPADPTQGNPAVPSGPGG